MHLADLRDKIERRTALIGVAGLGYVGLPLAHAFSTAGFPVLGFDIDQSKVDALGEGRQYLDHLADSMLRHLHEASTFTATSDMGRFGECDVILVAVPTPLGLHQEPDLSYVEKTAGHIGAALRPGQLLVLESTTYPGTTRDVFRTEVLSQASGTFAVGEDVFIAYSPEREDPGREIASTAVPKLVGGLEPRSAEIAVLAYEKAFEKVIAVASAEVGEAAKLLENIFRAVNIALVNEMKVVLQALDIDVWDVIEAAATKPYGFMPFYPGPGLGGHCIPIDPFYMTWKAKEVGQQVQFIELAGLVNRQMPAYVIERLTDGLNRHGKALSRSNILIVGLAYKAGVGDTRESPTYDLIELIQKGGGRVSFHDNLAPRTIPGRRHHLELDSVPLSPESVAEFDAVVIATAQDCVDWDLIAENAQLIVDTRNAMDHHAADLGARLIKA